MIFSFQNSSVLEIKICWHVTPLRVGFLECDYSIHVQEYVVEHMAYFSLYIPCLIDILILIYLRKKSHLNYHIMIIYYLHRNSDLTRNYLNGGLPKEWATMRYLNKM